MSQTALGHDFLPDLDRKATQKAIEAALERYRLYKYLTLEEREATITASYELREGGRSNRTSDQTAEVAIYNVDSQDHRRRYCERIEKAVARLPRMERFLIEKRYMCEDAQYITDYHVYCFEFQPPVNKDTYAKIRWRAFYKLAFKLVEYKLLDLNNLVITDKRDGVQ
ncbi:ArpU family phage packaging/lysis transcriptional regulator [Paenibacillus ginsengihumi]|uniref:ArpU family phage packaging/lysis transcriptional regulator n=1 Tax=Paenibacillus ginsengihumi TaxID=431596 RepID=UPI00036ADA45|nr:ArpU family phage packaging/lysis transcriptional regulator [Paenibacillus ginsengihumi]